MPKFSIFGDSMNTASRMESSCIPGHIQVSALMVSWEGVLGMHASFTRSLFPPSQVSDSTWALVKGVDAWRATGGIDVKG